VLDSSLRIRGSAEDFLSLVIGTCYRSFREEFSPPPSPSRDCLLFTGMPRTGAMWRVKKARRTNLRPPGNRSDSSSGRCLSGTCSCRDRPRGRRVCAATMFCARCVSRRFCDSSLSHDWLSSGWFACPPAAMRPETESRVCRFNRLEPIHHLCLLFSRPVTGGHVTSRKRS